ncbi:ferredoxin-thioredoxin reductase catalytic domain-containing protein [Marispirochaeta aestuarii]|uniref:ferredoxin-thioredoxin reductase catalytic domain-containing protein n=1 Tax=Marispirochaeta aestuarii TaxID=1963862 RepID=UPI0029C60C2F|nr:ferredoxin-thioredoxin reductase catalytic domain-containing protein [Marispirochaeta aestuarii]
MAEKTLQETENFVRSVAEHKGWILNRDEDFIGHLIEGLRVNYNRYGFYQCPCRDSYGTREKDKDIMCPCDYAQADIVEFGQCFCGLYLSPDFYETHDDIDGIPERRPEDLYPD